MGCGDGLEHGRTLRGIEQKLKCGQNLEKIYIRMYVYDDGHYSLEDTDFCQTVDITDSVEYKSLPSGLHNVNKDTV